MNKIKYHEHQWAICVDLKMVNLLLGQQGSYTKYPCFLCLWNRRSKQTHWIRKEWPVRSQLIVGERNVLHKQNHITSAAHKTWVNEAIHESSLQG